MEYIQNVNIFYRNHTQTITQDMNIFYELSTQYRNWFTWIKKAQRLLIKNHIVLAIYKVISLL